MSEPLQRRFGHHAENCVETSLPKEDEFRREYRHRKFHREGQFHSQVFARYIRYEPEVAEALTQMFISGVSTHKVGEISESFPVFCILWNPSKLRPTCLVSSPLPLCALLLARSMPGNSRVQRAGGRGVRSPVPPVAARSGAGGWAAACSRSPPDDPSSRHAQPTGSRPPCAKARPAIRRTDA
jgi:Transposase, Mutator family